MFYTYSKFNQSLKKISCFKTFMPSLGFKKIVNFYQVAIKSIGRAYQIINLRITSDQEKVATNKVTNVQSLQLFS